MKTEFIDVNKPHTETRTVTGYPKAEETHDVTTRDGRTIEIDGIPVKEISETY